MVTNTESRDLPTQTKLARFEGTIDIPPGGCIIKKMIGTCGPYEYHVKRVGKRQIWTYLGKVGSRRAIEALERVGKLPMLEVPEE